MGLSKCVVRYSWGRIKTIAEAIPDMRINVSRWIFLIRTNFVTSTDPYGSLSGNYEKRPIDTFLDLYFAYLGPTKNTTSWHQGISYKTTGFRRIKLTLRSTNSFKLLRKHIYDSGCTSFTSPYLTHLVE
jgi:hypothetical protein